jgi:Fe-S-cluster containining protein
VPFSKWEWDRIADKRKPTEEQEKILICPYAVDGRCEIYEKRPLLCRMFGAVDDPLLTCPHGCGPVNKLTKQEGREITAEYFKLMKKCAEAK